MSISDLSLKTLLIKKYNMKNFIYTLFILPTWIFGQTHTENYIKTTTYLSEYNDVTYGDYAQSLTTSDLINTGSGGGSGSIKILNNVLTVKFSGSWSPQPMKTGTIKTLTVNPPLPEMELGPILSSGNPNGFFAKIKENKLIFYSPFFLTGVNTTLTSPILGVSGVNYSVSTGTPYSCPSGGGGGGGGSITIANDMATLSLSAGWSSTCNLKTGNIVYLNTSSLPDTELGIITDNNGLSTNFKAKIENNWLIFYPIDPLLSLPSYGSLDFAYDFKCKPPNHQIITYYDGIGRPMQNIAVHGGGTSEVDLVTPITYDGYGRQTKEYLPVPIADNNFGSYRTIDVPSAAATFYLDNFAEDFSGMNTLSANPYSEQGLEASPLNRLIERGVPGADWKIDPNSDSDHTIKFEYQANTTGEVRQYAVSLTSDYTPSLQSASNEFYAPGELYKTVVKDENWEPGQPFPMDHTIEEFKDKLGRVVLKRTYNLGEPHDTYYVYDNFGSLTYVIPPKVDTSDGVSQEELDGLCYQYRYDYRRRLVEKKIPGKGDPNDPSSGWEYIVYNKLDQPIMTQDPNLKAKGQWLFTKYDAFGRVVYTGLVTRAASRATLQAEADGFAYHYEERPGSAIFENRTVYYTNRAYPNSGISEIHTENYYDTYLTSTAQAGISVPTANSIGEIISTQTKTLPTVSKVRVLDTGDWITTVSAYDEKGRAVWTKSVNSFLGTTDLVESDLDFTGKVLSGKTTHTKTGQATITTVDTYLYDHMGRLLEQKQKINSNATELIARNTYDELGQLVQEQVGGVETGIGLQQVDYTYNIRGWLSRINNPSSGLGDDLFASELDYNGPEHSTATPLFNGNISEVTWKTKNDNTEYWYIYKYDNLNRITKAQFAGGDFWSRYNTEGISYDKNGNITNLTRKGAINSTASSFGDMDILTYGYNSLSNQLRSVNDTGNGTYGFKNGASLTTEFTYDANANMITDANKGITAITYNHLNLPKNVTISGQTIDYVYDATGIKLKKTFGSTNTEYAGNFIYKDGVLEFVSTPEGYVTFDNGQFNYVYNYTDHLGNVRLSYTNIGSTSSPDLQIIEENNYYPFGLKHEGYNTGISSLGSDVGKKFKFNGIEFEESAGLGLYEMEFRQYDPAIARFTSLDPVIHHSMSPYMAFDANPIFWADPSGADAINGESVGADGLTDSQWIELSKPGGGGFDAIRDQARLNSAEIAEQKRKTEIEVGDLLDIQYSYLGEKPDKISLDNDTQTNLLNGVIMWAAYINSGNPVHLTEILEDGESSPSDLSLKGFKSKTIKDIFGEKVEFGYMTKYLQKNNAFSSHIIDYVYLYDKIGRYNQISFYTSLYNDPNKQPVAAFVRSLQSNFLEKIRQDIKRRIQDIKNGINGKTKNFLD